MSYAMSSVFNTSLMPANAGVFAAPARLKIGEFRRLVDRLNHSRNWLTGGTSEEFRSQAVALQLEPIIAELVDALTVLPARFEIDAGSACRAIESARRVVARWHAAQ